MAKPRVKPGQWHSGPEVDTASDQGSLVLSALSQALSLSPEERVQLTIDRQRLAGRSDIYIIGERSGDASSDGSARPKWVVKKPHPEWHQHDDVGNPLTAREEFHALSRLHGHFQTLAAPFRVPTPVCHLPTLDAYAIEYISGVTIKDLLRRGSLLRPRQLVLAMVSAGALLRQMHTLDAFPPAELNTQDVARTILALAEDRLPPAGLELPLQVRRILSGLPAVVIPSRQVRLHGDYGPGNLLLADDGSTVLIDPTLTAVGAPEEDLARFLTLMCGSIRFAPGLVTPAIASARRQLEEAFVRGYYGSNDRPAMLELAVICHLVPRWCRLRKLTERDNRNVLMPARLKVINALVRRLMLESARRLERRLEIESDRPVAEG